MFDHFVGLALKGLNHLFQGRKYTIAMAFIVLTFYLLIAFDNNNKLWYYANDSILHSAKNCKFTHTMSGLQQNVQKYLQCMRMLQKETQLRRYTNFRGGSRTAATSKTERLVIIITKRSILDVEAALDPPLNFSLFSF